MNEQLWVFMIKVMDKPGGLTAIASVFSNRGASIQSISGSATDLGDTSYGTITVCFFANVKRKRLLHQVVARLSCVYEVKALSYDSPNIRFAALLKVSKSHGATLLNEKFSDQVSLDVVNETETYFRIYVSGPGGPVYQMLEHWQTETLLDDVTLNVIAV